MYGLHPFDVSLDAEDAEALTVALSEDVRTRTWTAQSDYPAPVDLYLLIQQAVALGADLKPPKARPRPKPRTVASAAQVESARALLARHSVIEGLEEF